MGQATFHPRTQPRDRTQFARRRALLFLLFLTACDRPAADQSSAPAPQITPPPAPTFGGESLAFVSFLEAHGAFAVVHRFDADTNGDGAIDPKISDHGAPEGDWPSAWIYPLPGGEPERWDELVTSDPTDRWVVMRRGEELVALSSSKRVPLVDADPTPDPNPCLSARQASFDPATQWLVYLRRSPTRVVVHQLATGAEREIVPEGTLWRADAMPRGWVMLREVESEPPRRQGTCICRWCSRFASSVGASSFVGDMGREVLVDPRGGRHLDAPRAPVPLGDDIVWSMATNDLVDLGAKGRRLPTGCAMRILPLGAERVVVSCGERSRIWVAPDDVVIDIERYVKPVEPYVPASDGWVPVLFADDARKQHIGRLNLADGRIEPGPPALRLSPPHPSGWRLVADEASVWAWDVSTGSAQKLDLIADELFGLAAKRGDGWLVVDPTRPEPSVSLPEQPRFVAANGCWVDVHAYARPVKGPFVWRCR